jgi:2-aminoethylphosphonate transport system ATP-binding protein
MKSLAADPLASENNDPARREAMPAGPVPQADTGKASTQSPAAGAACGVRFDDVTVAYPGAVALENFSLHVAPGEVVALLGPSGSGKTTALRVVAGFVKPVTGRVFIGQREVTRLAPYERDIGMVVQQYALFPHMRVFDNVAFGLRARRMPRPAMNARVREFLAMVGMTDFDRPGTGDSSQTLASG